MKAKILIDLDVLTAALWDKESEAMEFLEKVKKGEFEVYTSRILSVKEIVDRSGEIDTDYKKIIIDLMSKGVKEEDAILVFTTSAFHLDYLVTYNRVHLRNKESDIRSRFFKLLGLFQEFCSYTFLHPVSKFHSTDFPPSLHNDDYNSRYKSI